MAEEIKKTDAPVTEAKSPVAEKPAKPAGEPKPKKAARAGEAAKTDAAAPAAPVAAAAPTAAELLGEDAHAKKIIKAKQMGARVGEVGFVLRYDQKMSDSKVVTSLTTLGYLVLIAKYMYPWGELGTLWQRQARERLQQAYGADGRPVEILELKRECAALPE